MKYLITKWVFILWPISLVMMHFVVFYVASFPVIVPAIMYPLITLWLLSVTRFSMNGVLFFLFILIYTFSLGLFADNMIEFMKSAVLFTALSILLLLVSKTCRLNREIIELSATIFVYLSLLVAVYTIVQLIDLNVFLNTRLINPFGPFGRTGPGGEIYMPHVLATLKRPNAFFSEPSMCGWFLAIAATVAILSKSIAGRKKTIMVVVILCGAMATLSMSGILNSCIIILYSAYLYNKGAFVLVAKVLVFSVVGISIFMAVMSDSFVSKRISDFSQSGSSTYYRVAAPLMLLSDSIPNYPFGHALGQTKYIEGKAYMQNWSDGSSTDIANAFFMISYYFGIIGISFSLLLMLLIIRMMLRKQESALIMIALALALAEIGAIWSPEIILMIGYCIIMYKHYATSSIKGTVNEYAY